MLTCLGYGGSMSFTDVRLSVPAVGFSDPVHSAEKILFHCEKNQENEKNTLGKSNLADEKKPLKNYEILKFEEDPLDAKKVTKRNVISFVTQVSIDRLTVLEYSLQTWIGGALSLVIHVPIENDQDEIKDWQRLYVKKKIAAMNLSLVESTVILASTIGTEEYPINSLRNLAIQHSKTPYLLLLDADFQPSPGMIKNFENLLSSVNITMKGAKFLDAEEILLEDENMLHKIAFVVPAFGYFEMPKVC